MNPEEHPSTSRLAGAIRARRIALGMSQEELNEATGISRSILSAMENGRFRSVRLLLEVCDALGLELFAFPREGASRVVAAVGDVLPPQQRIRQRVARAKGVARD